jgi:hypothetical protein
MNAFFDMLQLTHPFPFLYIALSGTNFVPTFLSMRLILPSLFGIQCSLTCITCTGIDRLLSVMFPIQYHKVGHLYVLSRNAMMCLSLPSNAECNCDSNNFMEFRCVVPPGYSFH